jgi:hypothetical protein
MGHYRRGKVVRSKFDSEIGRNVEATKSGINSSESCMQGKPWVSPVFLGFTVLLSIQTRTAQKANSHNFLQTPSIMEKNAPKPVELQGLLTFDIETKMEISQRSLQQVTTSNPSWTH